MKPDFEKIPTIPGDTFHMKTVERSKRPDLKGAWHFHPELEICLTLNSQGKRFVGNDISDYQVGDLVLLGKDLPHCWLTEEASKQIIIQMKKEFMGEHFLEKKEMQAIKNLFSKSWRGISFSGKTKVVGKEKILDLYQETGFNKIIKLLDLLHFLSESNEYQYLASEGYNPNLNKLDLERVQILYDYVIENFDKHVSVEQGAQLLNMTKSSFCKFIKKRTKKTFSQIVNEIRIGHACKLLSETEKSVGEICYKSGFNDISYFNRRFKAIMKCTPNEFKANYLEKNK